MRTYALATLVLLGMLSFTVSAFADTVYDFSASYSNSNPLYSGTVSGTITISGTTGLVVSADLTPVNAVYGNDLPLTSIDEVNYFQVPSLSWDPLFQYVVLYNSELNGVELAFMPLADGSMFVCTNYANPNACDGYNGINGGYQSFYAFDKGAVVDQLSSVSLTLPGSATPEPSSLVLLGTGILGAAGAAGRRRARC